MDIKLIPVSEEKVRIATEEIKKIMPVGASPEYFISSYNLGILSSGNPLVKEAVKSIVSAYKNLKLYSNKIVIRTEEEVAFDTSIELLKAWRLVSTIKRFALQMLDEHFAPDTKLLFISSKPGIIHYEGLSEESDDIIQQYWLKEKVFGGNSSLVNNLFLGKYVFEYDAEQEILGINLKDIIDIDDSFIKETVKDLIAKTFSAGIENVDNLLYDEEEEV